MGMVFWGPLGTISLPARRHPKPVPNPVGSPDHPAQRIDRGQCPVNPDGGWQGWDDDPSPRLFPAPPQ